jgi:ATP-binding cassette subfamily B protein
VPFLWHHWRPYRAFVPVLVGLTLGNAALVAVSPALLARVVDGVVAGLHPGRLAAGVAVLLAAGAAQVGIYLTLVNVRVRMNLAFDAGVRLRAVEHLLRKGPGALQGLRTGDVVTRLTDDVTEKLAWFMCSGVFRLLEASAILAAGLYGMVRLDPVLAACALGPLPVLLGIYVATARRLEDRSRDVQEAISREAAALETCLAGIRVVKSFGAEPMQREILRGTIETQRRAEMAAVRWQALVDTLYGQLWPLGLVLVLLVGGAAAARGDVSLGTLAAFDAWVLLLVHPVFDLAQFLVRGQASAVYVDRIREVEQLPEEVSDVPAARPLARRVGDAVPPPRSPEAPAGPLLLRYEDVSHRHGAAARETFSDLRFEARPGELTALTGPVGSGKSTALALAVRLMDPAGGRVTLGGRDVREWDPPVLRRAMALVPQEAQLLSASILENITLGRPWVGDADVARAVEAACLADEIASFPDGLGTQVGARGVRLSGGQKQRVALARALAGRPAVLLLDDVTASLDAATEERVWRALSLWLPDCAAVAVTHRPSTLARAARVVTMPGAPAR